MALTSEMISQFVKITNDNATETKKETTVYGTIVEYNEKKYVRLDGSDLLTPISTTANTTDGERVMVTIKNHTAIVTGNMSSPAARLDDLTGLEDAANKITEFEIAIGNKVDTEELVAANARIDELVADDITIRQNLASAEADIDNLQADNVTIKSDLTAAKANITKLQTEKLDVELAEITYATITDLDATNVDIHNLEATFGEFESLTTTKLESHDAVIDSLSSTYATIEDLEAEQARIDILEAGTLNADSAIIKQLQADVADIDTLIFGSASGDVIQSSFANAVIAQVGNAQIKSAMIESLSADKVTAGDIITNNVRVMSEDGKLLISDETIQITDDTRVRVQIGKDSSGDYSINIWDANGKLMFSEGGITDSAIKDAIIRDDMVSDTANISAHKLNIESLFEEINGSSNTIKASKIFLDSEAQTLDVVFTELTTQVDELEETITSQGTQLSVVQGQISGKVWQQDIESATGQMNTKYSSLEQTVDDISLVVTSHTTEIANKAEASAVTVIDEKVASLELSLNGFKSSVNETYAAKEDIKNMGTSDEIASINARVMKNESDITQNADDISAVVSRMTTVESDTAQNKSDIASLELTASGLTTRVTNVETDAGRAQTTADTARETASKAETLVQQLSDSISMLVTDGNGTSMMTQTESGWTFSTAEIQASISNATETLSALNSELGDTNSTVDVLKQTVDDLGELAEYIKIGTYEDEPCIELGEGDSDFKLLITNTRILFLEGSSVVAHITNQSLHIKKAVIEEELQQGGFVWKVRSNGNMGLVWKGVIE